MHEVKKNISIEDIVYFVLKQACELSNPVFGVSVKKRVNNQKLFFASAVKPNTDSTKSCLMCLAPHYLNHCKRFRNLSYQDRYKFVIQKKLCFACLQPGHRTDRCSKTDCCRKENCNKRQQRFCILLLRLQLLIRNLLPQNQQNALLWVLAKTKRTT